MGDDKLPTSAVATLILHANNIKHISNMFYVIACIYACNLHLFISGVMFQDPPPLPPTVSQPDHVLS